MNTRKSQKQQPKNKQNKRKGQRTHADALPTPSGVSTLSIPRSVGFIMPDRLRTRLRFWQSTAFNLSVTSSASIRYQPSAAFDIDPALGGTAMPGFNELAALYKSYRVRSSRVKVEVANTSPTAIVNATVLPVNLDPGATPAASAIVNARMNTYANFKTCPPVGGPITTLVSTMSTKKIYGNPMTDYDDNFAALVTSSPVNNWFWWISVYSLAVIAAATPVLLNTYVEVDIDFYDRSYLNA